MMSRTLARRLEDLEEQSRPIVGEARILTIDFVDRGGKVVDSREFKLPAPPPVLRGRPRRR